MTKQITTAIKNITKILPRLNETDQELMEFTIAILEEVEYAPGESDDLEE